MPTPKNFFTTIRTEGALLPPDLLQRIAEGATIDGLTPDSYHRPGEKLNEVINRSWNALQGAWASFQSAQAQLPPGDLGTTLTRERWLLPLFRELDYGRLQTASAVEIDGRSYPISHTAKEPVPIHLVSYQVKLDERTARVAGAASASPHSLLQVFLNRSEAHTWGFLSNGLKLRILRDNASLTRQAYVEFDLEAMMAGEVYSDFVLLWLLAHQSRVEGGRDCWLEKWMKTAEEQGTRALDQLRDGVEKAIEALGVGFLERPENAGLRDKLASGSLDKQDYYRQLLRLVYRLLFLFVAEDRGLLYDPETSDASREIYRKYYSTQRLRHMAESFKGTNHIDLFEGLRLTMHMLEGAGTTANGPIPALGARRLGLPVLGSFLFRDEAVGDLIDCKISNRNLLDAVRALSRVDDVKVKAIRSIDYKNLGPEELGSIYESLLELHPQINVPARTFALSTAGGNERKTTGSYYTPSSLISALLDSALDPVLEEAVYGEGGRKQRGAPLPGAADRVLALKVCDPACGSGHFLIAAANRMAKALASIRTGEEEPPPSAIQGARRDVIGHCIYGVDINPMAVELCKVNLWMEALEPGKPLSFLDHRIQVGNSLLGTTPRLMAEGIPSDAFNPIEGDDKAVVSKLRKQNAQERKDYEHGQGVLWDVIEPPADYQRIAADLRDLDALDDATLAGIRAKEERYGDLANDAEYQKARGLADAWCAAFVWEKTAANPLPPLTDHAYRLLRDNPLDPRFEAMRAYIARLRERYQFFHWHVTFPAVFPVPDDPQKATNEKTGWDGGFSCMLGNPPWEKIATRETEFFASVPEVVNQQRSNLRKLEIEKLRNILPHLYEDWIIQLRLDQGTDHFLRNSHYTPLTAVGELNLYPIFVEVSNQVIDRFGHIGLIVKTGMLQSPTWADFAGYLLDKDLVRMAVDFRNWKGWFPAIGYHERFTLLTLGAPIQNDTILLGYYLDDPSEIRESPKTFAMTREEAILLNPETRTLPALESKRHKNIILAIYQKFPVIADQLSDWPVRYSRGIDMTARAELLVDYETLLQDGYTLGDFSEMIQGGRSYKPLYEGKYIQQYDQRFSSFEGVPRDNRFGKKPATHSPTDEQKQHPRYSILPRYWVSDNETLNDKNTRGIPQSYVVAFRHTTNVISNFRTCVACICGDVAFSYQAPNLVLEVDEVARQAMATTLFLSMMNSFPFDYVARQKFFGANLIKSIITQLAVPAFSAISRFRDFIVPRVLELTYTAWDLQPFAHDIGYDGAPFVWDEERRFFMRCELDALYFHLYQITRDDADYILETFPIVKRKDEAAHGEYLTKRIILEMYDQMAALPTISVPAPKGDGDYRVPDVAQWRTWLTPEPASPDVAHGDR